MKTARRAKARRGGPEGNREKATRALTSVKSGITLHHTLGATTFVATAASLVENAYPTLATTER